VGDVDLVPVVFWVVEMTVPLVVVLEHLQLRKRRKMSPAQMLSVL